MLANILLQFFVSKFVSLTSFCLKKFLRKFNQELKIIIPIFALLLFLLNTSLTKDSFSLAREKILLNENDITSQQFLINLFQLNNQFALVETQSIKAFSAAESESKKQIFKSLLDRSKFLKSQEFSISEEIKTWGELLSSYPSYRDGYIKLAVLSWKTNRLFDTKKYLEKALILDPNFEVTNTILREATKSPIP